MNDRKLKIACLCGKTIGFEICKFLLKQDIELKIIVNDYEKIGEWYDTPRSLGINEIPLDQLSSFSPDLIIVAFYDSILKKKIYSLAPLGCWNLHLGDPQRYRGAYPNVWAIENGDKEYRVTLHQIDSGIDTGPILSQKSFAIENDDCGKRIYTKMTNAGIQLFSENYEQLISGEAIVLAQPQDNSHATLHYRKEFSPEITASQNFQNQVLARTFPPFEAPYFMIGNRKFIVTEESNNR